MTTTNEYNSRCSLTWLLKDNFYNMERDYIAREGFSSENST